MPVERRKNIDVSSHPSHKEETDQIGSWLRFPVGDTVFVRSEAGWCAGVVAAHWPCEGAAYQVQIGEVVERGGVTVSESNATQYVNEDSNECIRVFPLEEAHSIPQVRRMEPEEPLDPLSHLYDEENFHELSFLANRQSKATVVDALIREILLAHPNHPEKTGETLPECIESLRDTVTSQLICVSLRQECSSTRNRRDKINIMPVPQSLCQYSPADSIRWTLRWEFDDLDRLVSETDANAEHMVLLADRLCLLATGSQRQEYLSRSHVLYAAAALGSPTENEVVGWDSRYPLGPPLAVCANAVALHVALQRRCSMDSRDHFTVPVSTLISQATQKLAGDFMDATDGRKLSSVGFLTRILHFLSWSTKYCGYICRLAVVYGQAFDNEASSFISQYEGRAGNMAQILVEAHRHQQMYEFQASTLNVMANQAHTSQASDATLAKFGAKIETILGNMPVRRFLPSCLMQDDADDVPANIHMELYELPVPPFDTVFLVVMPYRRRLLFKILWLPRRLQPFPLCAESFRWFWMQLAFQLHLGVPSDFESSHREEVSESPKIQRSRFIPSPFTFFNLRGDRDFATHLRDQFQRIGKSDVDVQVIDQDPVIANRYLRTMSLSSLMKRVQESCRVLAEERRETKVLAEAPVEFSPFQQLRFDAGKTGSTRWSLENVIGRAKGMESKRAVASMNVNMPILSRPWGWYALMFLRTIRTPTMDVHRLFGHILHQQAHCCCKQAQHRDWSEPSIFRTASIDCDVALESVSCDQFPEEMREALVKTRDYAAARYTFAVKRQRGIIASSQDLTGKEEAETNKVETARSPVGCGGKRATVQSSAATVVATANEDDPAWKEAAEEALGLSVFLNNKHHELGFNEMGYHERRRGRKHKGKGRKTGLSPPREASRRFRPQSFRPEVEPERHLDRSEDVAGNQGMKASSSCQVVTGRDALLCKNAINAIEVDDGCPVCLRRFYVELSHDHVVVYPCGHAQCMPCVYDQASTALQKMAQARNNFSPSFQCPVCRHYVAANILDAMTHKLLQQDDLAMVKAMKQLPLEENDSHAAVRELLNGHRFVVDLVTESIEGMLEQNVFAKMWISDDLSYEEKKRVYEDARRPVFALDRSVRETRRLLHEIHDTNSKEYCRLRQELRELQEKRTLARQNASDEVYHLMNSVGAMGRCQGKGREGQFLQLDFHGLHPDEARTKFDVEIVAVLPVVRKVFLITGRGAHSTTGFSAVKETLIRHITSEQYRDSVAFERVAKNEGAIVVKWIGKG